MGGLRGLALGLMFLCAAGSSLYAVPVLKLSGGGGHTTDITSCMDPGILGPNTCLVLFNPTDLLSLDPSSGLGSLGIKNDLSQTITAMEFFLPTDNFNQTFIATTVANTPGQTTIFANATLNFIPAVGPLDGYTIADFFGTGTGTGSTVSANPCTGPFAFLFNCPANGPVGFDLESLQPDQQFPNGEGFLIVTTGTANSGPLTGLVPCSVNAQTCEATFTSAIPEPGLFPLLISAMGLVVTVRRKLYRR